MTIAPWTLAVLVAGGAGLLIGSFLNVVIFRVPAGRSIVSPPSACGGCGAGIRPFDNIPVLSWLLLRGRCRRCGAAWGLQGGTSPAGGRSDPRRRPRDDRAQ